jgi:hypothetical protein
MNNTLTTTLSWYRRPSYAPYEAEELLGDLAIGYAAYPNTLKFGGNTGTTNSFTGVDVANFTSGAFNVETLFEGDNFACFTFQLLQQGLPDFASVAVNALAPATSLVNQYVGPLVGGLSCPQLGQYDYSVFDQFPGYTYEPNGPDTNYKA